MDLQRIMYGGWSGIPHYHDGALLTERYEKASENFEALYHEHIPRHIQTLIHLSTESEKIRAVIWKPDNTCVCQRENDTHYTHLAMPTEEFARFTHDPELDRMPVNPFEEGTPAAVRNQLSARCAVVEEVHHAAFMGLETRPGWKEAVTKDFGNPALADLANHMRAYYGNAEGSQKVALSAETYAGKEHIEAIPDLLHAYGYFRDLVVQAYSETKMEPEVARVLILNRVDNRMMEHYPNTWPMMKAYDLELKARANALERAAGYAGLEPDLPEIHNAGISDIDVYRAFQFTALLAELLPPPAVGEAFDLAAAIGAAAENNVPAEATPNATKAVGLGDMKQAVEKGIEQEKSTEPKK